MEAACPVVAAHAARGAGPQALLDELPRGGWSRRSADNHTFVVRHYWGEVSYAPARLVADAAAMSMWVTSPQLFRLLRASRSPLSLIHI